MAPATSGSERRGPGRLHGLIRPLVRLAAAAVIKIREALRERGFYGSDDPELARWKRDRGDEILRLSYELDEGSVVVDAGGYRGQWASDIHSRFRCLVHVFEPVPAFHDYLVWRFESNPLIVVHGVGLSGSDKDLVLGLAADATSVHVRSAESVTGRAVGAAPYLSGLGLHRVDLMKINIEGGEYELLEHLFETGYIEQIEALQVQFHDMVPDARERGDSIRQRLSDTHRSIYRYEFVWESWVKL